MNTPKLPNDIIMYIIRLADGGRHAHKCHKENFIKTLDLLDKAKRQADNYIERHVVEEEYDWDRGGPVVIADSIGMYGARENKYTYNFSEWKYAFFDIIEDHQMRFRIVDGKKIYTWDVD